MNKAKTQEISRSVNFYIVLKSFLYKYFCQTYILKKNSKKDVRFLEIGPGENRINNFETINIFKNRNTDYVGDAAEGLPFNDESFDIVYASHILEHIAWYMLDNTIEEWVRVLKPGGIIEIWVPDGLRIANAFVDGEIENSKEYLKDGWFRFNDEKDINKWFCGRMFSYGDGMGTKGHFNYHLAAFSERYLRDLLKRHGIESIRKMKKKECRGFDHGWINLGVRGVKK